MSEHAIEFLQEWIGEKVQAPCQLTRIETQAESLARECAAEAAEAGIPLEDIQEEVGDIQDLITSKLEEAFEAAESGQTADGDRDSSAARTAENENTRPGKP
jgi:CHAD domain-containing protein